jgi:hypothetical protein
MLTRGFNNQPKGGRVMKNLNPTDVAAIALSWTGAGTVAYLMRDPIVAIVCVAAAYYLAKWIILKKES